MQLDSPMDLAFHFQGKGLQNRTYLLMRAQMEPYASSHLSCHLTSQVRKSFVVVRSSCQ